MLVDPRAKTEDPFSQASIPSNSNFKLDWARFVKIIISVKPCMKGREPQSSLFLSKRSRCVSEFWKIQKGPAVRVLIKPNKEI